MPSRPLTFTNDDGIELAARLELPADAPRAYAVFAHCFTCSKDLRAARSISEALSERGFAVLRFDFTGLGESEGEFSETTFSSNASDLVAAAQFLEEEYEAPSLLVGHSLGGAAVLQAAADIPSTKAVATIGSPCRPDHVQKLLREAVGEIEEEGEAHVTLAGRSFTIKQQFLDDLEAHTMNERIRALDVALMVFHSPVDEIVGIEEAGHLFQAARHPKSFISLDDADHLLTRPSDATYVGHVLAAWAERYVEPIQPIEPETPTAQLAARTPAEGYRTELQAGRHRFVADEPKSVGGTDAGPTPYDYLAAALGSCTTMTLRMYADRKGWPLEEAIAYVEHETIHAEDCAHCETEKGRISRLTRRVKVIGDLDEKQRARLLEIANRCPVRRTLASEIDIQSELVE